MLTRNVQYLQLTLARGPLLILSLSFYRRPFPASILVLFHLSKVGTTLPSGPSFVESMQIQTNLQTDDFRCCVKGSFSPQYFPIAMNAQVPSLFRAPDGEFSQ
jgi:hypothetical protein